MRRLAAFGVLLATVSLAIAALARVTMTPTAPRSATEIPREPGGALLDAPPADLRAAQPPAQPSARVAVVSHEPEVPLAPLAAPSSVFTVEARFVDDRGKPLEGVSLVHRAEKNGELDGTTSSARSDAYGFVRLELGPAGDAGSLDGRLVAHRTGRASRSLAVALVEGETAHLGTVVLSCGGAISGRIVDSGGGAVGALVRAYPARTVGRGASQRRTLSYSPCESNSSAHTAADGSFRVDGLPPGEYVIGALTIDSFTAFSEAVEVRGEDVAACGDLRVVDRELEDSIEGRVLGSDGEPVVGATVSWIPRSHNVRLQDFENAKELESDPGGSFRLDLIQRYGVSLVAWDPQRRFASGDIVRANPGERGLELRLFPTRSIEVRVLTQETGEPIAGASVFVGVVDPAKKDPSGKAVTFGDPAYESLKTDESGRVSVVEPTKTYRIDSRRRNDYARSELREPGAGDASVTLELSSLSASPTSKTVPAILVRTLVEGRPAADVEVGVHNASPPDRFKFSSGSSVDRDWDPYDAYRESEALRAGAAQTSTRPFAVLCSSNPRPVLSSDVEGVLRLPLDSNRGGWVVLSATKPGLASTLVGPFTKEKLLAFGDRGLSIDLFATGSIEGVCSVPAGAELAGTVVGVSRGDGVVHVRTVGPDGRFRFDGLAAGGWQVRSTGCSSRSRIQVYAYSDTAFHPHDELVWDCEVRPGSVTSFDLDLSRFGRTLVAGRIAMAELDLTGWSVAIANRDATASEDSSVVARATLAPGGIFELTLFEARPVWIQLTCPSMGFQHWIPLDLHEGRNDVSLDVPTGEFVVEGSLIGCSVLWGSATGPHGAMSMRPREGRLESGPMPAGTVQIFVERFSSGCTLGGPSNEFAVPHEPAPAGEGDSRDSADLFFFGRLDGPREVDAEELRKQEQVERACGARSLVDFELAPGERRTIRLPELDYER